jgi:hypothetical protein
MPNRKKSERYADNPPVRTAGKVFTDGSILELVRGPNGELRLMLWDGKSAKTAPEFVRHDETFVPLRVDHAIQRALQLPSKTMEYGSTRELFTEISNLIARVPHIGDAVVQLSTFSVFATWLADCLPIAPYLWIVVPPTTTGAPLAQLLGLLCRRALIISDFSSAGFYSLPADLEPTLLIEVFEPTRRVLNLLRASKRHGVFIAAGGKAKDAFSAKIVFASKPLRDPASAGFPLELVLHPTREYVPLMSTSEAERVAAQYQAKLLRYRLLNWAKVPGPAFDLSQFTVPMREHAFTLAASIVDDDKLQNQIVPLLKPLDAEIRVVRTTLLLAIVLEALLARCHNATGKYFAIGDLTGDVNTILRGRGDLREVSPEEIGWTLRGLGLHTDFMPGGRKALILLNDVRKKIHELAAAYGVRTLRELPTKAECPLCAALAAEWKLETNAAGTIEKQA